MKIRPLWVRCDSSSTLQGRLRCEGNCFCTKGIIWKYSFCYFARLVAVRSMSIECHVDDNGLDSLVHLWQFLAYCPPTVLFISHLIIILCVCQILNQTNSFLPHLCSVPFYRKRIHCDCIPSIFFMYNFIFKMIALNASKYYLSPPLTSSSTSSTSELLKILLHLLFGVLSLDFCFDIVMGIFGHLAMLIVLLVHNKTGIHKNTDVHSSVVWEHTWISCRVFLRTILRQNF